LEKGGAKGIERKKNNEEDERDKSVKTNLR